MMAYSQNFVLSVISNGSPVKEFSENGHRTCTVPFDQEYKIRLKNKSHKRAKAKVFIDGSSICSGDRSFVLNPGQTIDLERWVDSNEQGKKFKFIALEKAKSTGQVDDPTSSDNGFIRVEFYEESWSSAAIDLGTPTISSWNTPITADHWNSGSITFAGVTNSTLTATSSLSGSITNCSSTQTCVSLSASTIKSSGAIGLRETFTKAMERLERHKEEQKAVKTAGVTSQGSDSNQQFAEGMYFETSSIPTIITLKLRGPAYKEAPKVVIPKTTKDFLVKLSPGLVEVWKNDTLFVDSNNAKITINDDGLTMRLGFDIEEGESEPGFEINSRSYDVTFVS